MASPPSGSAGFLRRALSRLTSSDAELEAAELREEAAGAGATPCAEVADRSHACISGTLRAVTLRPRAGVPALEAELYDGSGTVSIIWLGRRRIPGIEPGRVLVARGTVSIDDGRRVMFNPRYELRSAAAGSE
jgi:hypothetical protein